MTYAKTLLKTKIRSPPTPPNYGYSASPIAIRSLRVAGATRTRLQTLQAGLHVHDAIAGKRFDAGRVVEDFDGDPAAVVDIGQGAEDGDEVEIAHAGAAEVGVVGVEVVQEAGVFAEELRDGLRFAGHGFAVEVQ